jgi:hypothetical protein
MSRRLNAAPALGLLHATLITVALGSTGCLRAVGYERGTTVPYAEAYAHRADLGKLIDRKLASRAPLGNEQAFYLMELLRTKAFVRDRLQVSQKDERKVDPAYRDLSATLTWTPAAEVCAKRGLKLVDASSDPAGGCVERRQLKLVPSTTAAAPASEPRGGQGDELFWDDLKTLERRLEAYRKTNSYLELPYGAIFNNRYVITSKSDVQLSLSPGEALLEYYFSKADDSATGVLLTRKAMVVKRLPRARSKIVAEVRWLWARLAGAKPGWEPTAQSLHEALIAPFADALKAEDTKALFIVPSDVLTNLPFAVLHGPNGPLLLERYRLSYLPSFSVYKNILTRTRPKVPPRMLALGNPPNRFANAVPLTAAEKEAATVGDVFEGSAPWLGEDASEERFYSEQSKYNVLHFATHGMLNNADPMKSLLLLRETVRDDKVEEDGFLSAAEIRALNLSDKYVVVLSACETNLSFEPEASDDLTSLGSAFLVAGAPSVVGTFWEVDDASTTELMLDFYANFLELGTAEALRRAQLGMRSRRTDADGRDFSHPAHWAPFALQGFDK